MRVKSQIVYYDDDAVCSYIIKPNDIVINLSRFVELNLDIESFARITKMYCFTNKKMLVIHYLYNFDNLKELEQFINEVLIEIFTLKRKSDFITLEGKAPFRVTIFGNEHGLNKQNSFILL